MKKQYEPTAKQGLQDMILQCTFGIALFMIFICSMNDTVKTVVIYLLPCVLVTLILGRKQWRSRISQPMFPLCLLVFFSGCSTFYALAPKFALYEFLGVLLGFTVFSAFVVLAKNIRQIAGAIVLTGTFTSLLSVDLISSRTFFPILEGTIKAWSNQYTGITGIEEGVRMTSILINPNIFSGCIGIAVILALGLVLESENSLQRRVFSFCLMVNAIAFVLAFSMGGTATIVVAFLVYLILEPQKIKLFLLMIETFIFSLLASFPIFATSFGKWEEAHSLPMLCVFGAGIALIFVHETIGRKALAFFEPKEKQTKTFILVILALLALFGLAAVTMTSEIDLEAGESFRRSLYLDAGEYTLTVDSSTPVQVRIITQNKEQTMMHTNTSLYRGNAEEVTFTVPEDSLVIYFDFSVSDSGQITRAEVENTAGKKEAIHLDYPLLPGFISTRLQGLWANQNAIQRFVFFEDGMQLFYRSPLFGLGMGSFENALFQVQSFYYETKYVHNHYIQLLLELGVVGLFLFLWLLATMLQGLWKLQKSSFGKTNSVTSTETIPVASIETIPVASIETNPIASTETNPVASTKTNPVINSENKQEGTTRLAFVSTAFALMTFMFSHAAVEVIWSSSYYLVLAFSSLAFVLCLLPPSSNPKKNPLDYKAVQCVILALSTVFMLLLYGNMEARKMAESSSDEEFLETLLLASKIDRFEYQDYLTSYIHSATFLKSSEVHKTSLECIAILEQIPSNTTPYYIAMYYFSQDNTADAVKALVNYVNTMASNPDAWNMSFSLLLQHQTESNQEEILEALELLYDKMLDWNASHMGTLVLHESFSQVLIELFPEK